MPDNAAAPASEGKPALPDHPDRVGEELADDAKIWHVYDKVAREDDERRTKAWDNGLNNLALFAGLFSAVTTAFIIEAQQDMEPDYAQLTFLVLNASASGEKFVQQPFTVPPSARTVNCLWVASLILSLSAALIAIMGKDWIGMYTARPVCNLRQWAEMRSYRLNCVEQWYMSGVIAAAPVLLHISLLLFGAGLVVFISSDPLTHHLTLGLSLAAGVLYLVTTFSAVVFSTSPFKSPATQMLRATLFVLFSSLRSVVYRPKRNLVVTLLRDINTMVVGPADDSTPLPGGAHETRKLRVPRLASAGRAAIAYMRNIPTSVRTACHGLQWSNVRSRLRSIVLPLLSLPIEDWFLSSTWTDLPIARRPKLLADALSWLSGASQAPDVFRAIVFALGDLDIGAQVGLHTSIMLRTRLRAEFRQTWKQVDLLSFSRYVLADCNTSGDSGLALKWLVIRFYEPGAIFSTCEEALAARVRLWPAILPFEFEHYFPGTTRVTQPRMAEFLLPYILQTKDHLLDDLVVIAHRYRAHLWEADSFTFTNLEAHLYRALDTEKREAYATEVEVKYGGTPGAVELLTFVCCHDIVANVTKMAAVELVLELMEHPRVGSREHRCLAYLLGGFEPWNVAWADKHRSSDLIWMLARSLQPSSARMQFGDKKFDLALARALVMLISPRHDTFGLVDECMVWLLGYLRQPLIPSGANNDGKLGVIRLILKSGALLRIVGIPEYTGYADNWINSGTAILSEVINELGRHLRGDATVLEGNQLFGALVASEVEGADGATVTWNLGDWLRTTVPEILKQCPSSATAMGGLHDALVGLYSLCETNHELRAIWDGIGYPGRPGDVFSDPFLDVGAFFENAEAPRARPGNIFDDPWLDLTEFFDGAEDGNYRWLNAPLEWA